MPEPAGADDPDAPEEPELAPTDPLRAADPAPDDPPPPGAGACTDGSDGVETAGVRTGLGAGA